MIWKPELTQPRQADRRAQKFSKDDWGNHQHHHHHHQHHHHQQYHCIHHHHLLSHHIIWYDHMIWNEYDHIKYHIIVHTAQVLTFDFDHLAQVFTWYHPMISHHMIWIWSYEISYHRAQVLTYEMGILVWDPEGEIIIDPENESFWQIFDKTSILGWFPLFQNKNILVEQIFSRWACCWGSYKCDQDHRWEDKRDQTASWEPRETLTRKSQVEC